MLKFHVNNIELRDVRMARIVANTRGDLDVVAAADRAMSPDLSDAAEEAALWGLATVCEYLNRAVAS